MVIDKATCLELLEEFDINPSKDKGQNYLINPSIAEKIVDSLEVGIGEKVLEIGPGLGSLTNFLDEKCEILTVVDIDKQTCEALGQLYPDANILCMDALRLSISDKDRIISNVPYNITSEMIEYILLKGTRLKQTVLMIQEDAYKRIVATKGKDYGPLSVLINSRGKVKPLFKVSPNDFYPRPKCVSIVFSIDIDPNKHPLDDFGYKVVKTLFTNRRKTIFNNLNLLTSKEKAAQILAKLNISDKLRPEQISPETYIKLVSLYREIA